MQVSGVIPLQLSKRLFIVFTMGVVLILVKFYQTLDIYKPKMAATFQQHPILNQNKHYQMLENVTIYQPEMEATFQKNLILISNKPYQMSENITLFKNTYHWFKHEQDFGLYLSVHFDDRRLDSTRDQIRFKLVTSFKEKAKPIYVFTWLNPHLKRVELQCKYELALDNKPLRPKQAYPGMPRYRYAATCQLPEKSSRFEYITVTMDKFIKSLTNLAPIVHPFPYENPYDKSIGLCGGNFYGDFQLPELYLFINWMEALLMFGIKEVTINNLNIINIHEYANKVFKYYSTKGYITVTNYKTIFEKRIPTRYGNKHDDIHLLNLLLNKCLHDNRDRYWFTLVNDWDELFVPMDGSKTYRELLENIQQNYNKISGGLSKEYTFDDVKNFRAAPVYVYRKSLSSSNDTLPAYLVTLRLAQATAHALSQSKSFQNPRLCTFAGIHRCDMRIRKEYGTFNLDKSYMTMYHFRDRCQYANLCHRQVLSNHTRHLRDHFGAQLRRRVERVMRDLGYASYIEEHN